MKEVIFIRKNMQKWKDTEALIRHMSKTDPAEIANTYEDVSADLAFAQTHYPESDLVPYLNSLALVLHNCIYGNKQQRASRLITFWTEEIPHEVYNNRWMMILALALFIFSAIVGVFSCVQHPDFVRTIMGDQYVEMTLRNIEQGEPMAVYGNETSGSMMLGITLNNIWVSFYTYISGMLTCFGTAYFMLVNGVMCGAFMTFCYQHGVLTDCLESMWMHGVIEITSIIVAGGAGLTLGKGWLFPGSYPRKASFTRAARSSVKIIIGLVPFFIIAGFIESYITRHTEMPEAAKLLIIGTSLLAMIGYFIYLPYKTRQKIS